ncbi:hypothetical protein [Wohlfahrtiimonas larvae]|uniref:Uncharacterized protein n=1 Tax=Wohlfahrtiimonas larvae TaxID=1157986 RepID=A0ABP9MXC6_9GAMM|nr:hypothetical protein [Wohlfahrtiimonas larvae]
MKRTALMVSLVLICSSTWAKTATEAQTMITVDQFQQSLSKQWPNPSVREIVGQNSQNDAVVAMMKEMSELNYKHLVANSFSQWFEVQKKIQLGQDIQPQLTKTIDGVGEYQWSTPYTYSWLKDAQSLMAYEESTEQFLLLDMPINNVRLFVTLEPQELVVYFSLKESDLDEVIQPLNHYFKNNTSEDDNILSNGQETVLLSRCYDGECSMEYTVKNFMSTETFIQTFQKEFFTNMDVAPYGIAFHRNHLGLASVTLSVRPSDLSKVEDGLAHHYGQANYPNINGSNAEWVSKDGAIRTYTIGKTAYIEFNNYSNVIEDLTKNKDLLKCYDQTALKVDFEKALEAQKAVSDYICGTQEVMGVGTKELNAFCQSEKATYQLLKNTGIESIIVGTYENLLSQQQIEQLIQSCSQ